MVRGCGSTLSAQGSEPLGGSIGLRRDHGNAEGVAVVGEDIGSGHVFDGGNMPLNLTRCGMKLGTGGHRSPAGSSSASRTGKAMSGQHEASGLLDEVTVAPGLFLKSAQPFHGPFELFFGSLHIFPCVGHRPHEQQDACRLG